MKRLAALASLLCLALALSLSAGCQSQPAAPQAGAQKPAATQAGTQSQPPAQAAQPSGGSAPAEIKIGASIPITGPLAAFGKYTQWGYKRAVDQINADGGLMLKQYNKKVPVKLTLLDDESKPEKSASNVERLILQDKVDALLGSAAPDVVISGANVAERYKVPMIAATAPLGTIRAARPQWNYLWVIFFDEADMAKQQMLAMNTAESNKKVSLFLDNSPDAEEQGKMWNKYAKEMGYEIAYTANFPGGTVDFGDLIRKTQASGADIVIGQMMMPDAVSLWRQMESLNYKPKAAFLEKGSEPVEFWQTLKKSAQGVCVAGFWHPDMGYPGAKDLAAAFEKESGEKWSQHIADTYVVAQVMLQAIQQAGSLDKEAVNKAMPEAITAKEWVVGKIKFNADHTAMIPTVMLQWQDGDTKIINPKEKATAKLIYPIPSWADLKK